jgi:ABC-type polysaccharide/polyol phosphate export permease
MSGQTGMVDPCLVRHGPDRPNPHLQVILALAKRDLQSRFGANWLGYAWTYVAPLAWIGATYLAFYLFGRMSPVYTDTITFIISGLIPYAAFRYAVTAIGRTNTSIRGLLIFPAVQHEHAVAATAMIEFANIFVIFGVVALVNYLVFGNGELANPFEFVWGMSLAWGLGVGYSYLFTALSRDNPTIAQVGQVLLRPTFFLSGIFFTANELPGPMLSVLTWNPLLHAVEIARDGMLFHYQSRVASSAYVVAWIAALLTAGAIASFSRRP